MFGKLLPRETSFFDFFESHAQLTLEGVSVFRELIRPGANIGSLAKRVKELEHETDVVTHRCVAALHKTFITPIERNDIYRLISTMDDIMDNVEATSERIMLYELSVMRPELGQMADILGRCVLEVQKAVVSLR